MRHGAQADYWKHVTACLHHIVQDDIQSHLCQSEFLSQLFSYRQQCLLLSTLNTSIKQSSVHIITLLSIVTLPTRPAKPYSTITQLHHERSRKTSRSIANHLTIRCPI